MGSFASLAIFSFTLLLLVPIVAVLLVLLLSFLPELRLSFTPFVVILFAVLLICVLVLFLSLERLAHYFRLLFDENFGINFAEAMTGLNWPANLLDGAEEVGVRRFDMGAASNRVLLRPSSASTRVECNQWLTIWSLCVLILHVRVKGGIRQVRLIAECALVISPLHIVLASSLLLLFAAFSIGPL